MAKLKNRYKPEWKFPKRRSITTQQSSEGMLTITNAPKIFIKTTETHALTPVTQNSCGQIRAFCDDLEKTDPSALLSGMHTRLALMGNKGDSSKH